MLGILDFEKCKEVLFVVILELGMIFIIIYIPCQEFFP